MDAKWQEYFLLIGQLIPTLSFYTESQELMTRVIKLITLPSLHNIATRRVENVRLLLDVVRYFPQKGDKKTEAFLFLKGKINERTFPVQFLEYLDSFDKMVQDGEVKALSQRWKGF